MIPSVPQAAEKAAAAAAKAAADAELGILPPHLQPNAAGGGGSSIAGNPNFVPRTPCKFHLAGFCANGARCSYLHPPRAQLDATQQAKQHEQQQQQQQDMLARAAAEVPQMSAEERRAQQAQVCVR